MAARLLKATESYVNNVLGAELRPRPWHGDTDLPFYLQDRYEFSAVNVSRRKCLLMLARDTKGETPAVVRKHLQTVGSHFQGPVIYVVDQVTSYNRKRLIEQRVPFVVPGKQMYLPMLGLDLRERFQGHAVEKNKSLGAVAQVLLLREVYQPGFCSLAAKGIAEKLGYSAMSIGRAVAELADKKLVNVETVGREKRLVFPEQGKALWLLARKHLTSPVKKRVWVAGEELRNSPAPAAGETALAHYTMLGEPRNRVVAISAKEWPGQRELLHLRELPRRDDPGTQVELWRYTPRCVKEGPYVDELSLWLSVKDSDDERVALAADELLGAMKW